MTEALAFLAGLAAGLALHLLACRRIAKRTGQPLRAVILGGGPKPTTPV